MNAEEARRWLDALAARGMSLGLERMEALLAELGDPHASYDWVHVGGTNGKGSVAAMSEAMLRAAGHRVGLYTSPHLVRFRERVRVDGAEIDDDALARAATTVRAAAERAEKAHGPLTYFEAATAVAFLHFDAERVDVAVVEVGLGGRLDATNVHPAPLATVLTNVGHDHLGVLGDDLQTIAREKAAIFRAGVPALTGAADEALPVVEEEAARVGAPLRVLGRDLAPERLAPAADGNERFRLGDATWTTNLRGAHQVANATLALAAMDAVEAGGHAVPTEARRKGLLDVRWRGRLETLPGRPTFLLDGAHNPEGVHALAAYLKEKGLRPTLLFGVLEGKPWPEMVAALAEQAGAVVATRAPDARAVAPNDLAREFSRCGVVSTVVPDVGHALDTAVAQAGPDGLVLVTGSLYLVGDVLRRREAA